MVKDTVEFEAVVGRRPEKPDHRSADDEQFRLTLEKEELRKLIFDKPPRAPSNACGESAVRTEPKRGRLDDERRSCGSVAADGARFQSPRARDVAAARPKAKRNARSDEKDSEPTDRRRARATPNRNPAGAAGRPERLPAVSYIAAAVLLVASGLGARLVWPDDAVDPLPRPNRVETVRATDVAPKAARPATRDEAIAEPPKVKHSQETIEEAPVDATTEQARPLSSEIAMETPSLGAHVAPPQTTAAAAPSPPNARIWPGRFSFSDNGASSAVGSIRFSTSPRVESPAAADAKPASAPSQIRNDKGPNAAASHIEKRMSPRPRSVAPAASVLSAKARAAEQSDIVGQDRALERRDDDRAEQLEPPSRPASNEFERPSLQGALESLAEMLRDGGQPRDGAR